MSFTSTPANIAVFGLVKLMLFIVSAALSSSLSLFSEDP